MKNEQADAQGISIAHVTVEVRRPDRWKRFVEELLGDRARVVWDDAARRGALRLIEGPRDDLAVLGLAAPSEGSFRAIVERLGAANVGWEAAEAPGGAREAVRFLDPAGNVVELILPAGDRHPDSGWPTGHVALAHRDPAVMETFYADVVGFRCNERTRVEVGPIEIRGTFLGSAVRHHTLAVLSVPSLRRLHHVMIGAADVADVVEAHHRARRAGIGRSLELGRHGGEDRTLSFYAASPSGFDVEIGAGGGVLDGRHRSEVPESGSTSSWGHEISVGARLRVVTALVARGLGFAA